MDDKQERQATSEFDDVEVKLAQLGPEPVRQGIAITPQIITKVTPGTSSGDVRRLWGKPVDGTNSRWWLYNVNLPLGSQGNYLVCQLGVEFDSAGRVSGTKWRRPQCAALYEEFINPATPDIEEITLFSDVLFDYDSVTLSPAGLKELDLAAEVVVGKLMQLERVVVVGHSDRIGSDSYNNPLSQRRAAAVRNYLVSKGIGSHLISAEGRGSREPLVECRGNAITASLKQCLQPNRRVQIMIYGQR